MKRSQSCEVMSDLYKSDKTKAYRADYRLERTFFFHKAAKHATQVSKDRYKLSERIQSRYETHLRPEYQPSMRSCYVNKNKKTETDIKEEARPSSVKSTSNYNLRIEDSQAAVRMAPQKSPPFNIMSRNPFHSDAFIIHCADPYPFRQDDEEMWPTKPMDTDTSCLDQIESFIKMVDDDNLSRWEAENEKLRSQKALLRNVITKYILGPVRQQHHSTVKTDEVFERLGSETTIAGNTTSWHNPLAEHAFEKTFAEMPFEEQEHSLAILENDKLRTEIAELQSFIDECVFTPAQYTHRYRGSDQETKTPSTTSQPFDKMSITKQYQDLFVQHDETALKQSAEGRHNGTEDLLNSLHTENEQLKADNKQLKGKLTDILDFAADIGGKLKLFTKQSQERIGEISTQVEGTFEKLNILKNKSKPKKNKWLKIFSRKKKGLKDQ